MKSFPIFILTNIAKVTVLMGSSISIHVLTWESYCYALSHE